MGLLAGAEHASESSGEEEEYDDLDDSVVHSSNGKTKAPYEGGQEGDGALDCPLYVVGLVLLLLLAFVPPFFVFLPLTIVLARWYRCPRFDPRCSCAYLYSVYVRRTCSPRHVV